ncbi:Not1 N-terminal domain, CCR4-Not complex component-domain-containing protein [Fimicolochytrium jonesii]|uniref:Not1 N-terminal domain, CCR4-Not complex component-domain-containing protein n=1 Tax=Fimicolochytrium jonesii TaxID=1396493 RepID=UPI0022FE7593|nr:Not1 N-terminal domain, CCR4-Not complex component-domain-containing protein [Fimicolochytrium jonesii]KAI8819838.1 Not1 N-terminal domain, CCR4-Not complex component-domain-containing protein [Fimicolochytrium jonesii]
MANRKLLGEIDKVLKRVAEGVEIFREIFDKLDAATTSAQKEKYEGDLKKEIKKLQRLRDQIRTWLSSSEIKDKRSLEDNRRLIEEQMERFKAAEKALKLKAFSKEGLLQPQKYDPEVKEREDLEDWISDTVKELNRQVEIFEAEQESLQVLVRKGRKGGDQSKAERLAAIDHHLERHKFHMTQLEIIQRMVANEELKVQQVKDIKDDVDYYVKNNQDSDFDENEYIYEDLDLENLEAYGLKADGEQDLDGEPETPPKEKENELGTPVRDTKVVEEPTKKKAKEKEPEEIVTPTKSTPSKPLSRAHSASKPPIAVKTPIKVVAVPARNIVPTARVPDPVPVPSITQRYSAAAAASAPTTTEPSRTATISAADKRNVPKEPAPVALSSQVPLPAVGTAAHILQLQQQTAADIPASSLLPSTTTTKSGLPDPGKDDAVTEPIDNRLPPTLADLVQSFEATRDRSTKARDDASFLHEMLQTSFQHLPEPVDSEKPKHYIPKKPYPVPAYYPQLPLSLFDNPTVYEKFDTDVLFFIFYYQQGTYQQFLAARELKRQSWRFHKKYLTWFQRHEEPKQITDEFEMGTYIYFDYEGAWCQRKKADFRFEYRYLEDAEM